ncbi:MAG: SIS domain-containing protein [Deltaproteobacteria bacterium]|nr:SIS domain-containing protein [Deltaproteobacteria bacterium]
MDDLRAYLDRTAALAGQMPLAAIEAVIQRLIEAGERDQAIFVMGNGGSAATASHFANDLSKGDVGGSARRLRVLALTDNVALMTAWANDTAYQRVFAEQLRNFARPGDVVIGVSASGRSANVLEAVRLGRAHGACTIGFTGQHGGDLKQLVDHCVQVPSDNVQHVEDLHLVAFHLVYSRLRDTFLTRPHDGRHSGGNGPAALAPGPTNGPG